MIIVCPECSRPYELANHSISALVKIACPHCEYRMILDFEAANDPGLREDAHRDTQGFADAEAYRQSLKDADLSKDAAPILPQPEAANDYSQPRPAAPQTQPEAPAAAQPSPTPAEPRPTPAEPRPAALKQADPAEKTAAPKPAAQSPKPAQAPSTPPRKTEVMRPGKMQAPIADKKRAPASPPAPAAPAAKSTPPRPAPPPLMARDSGAGKAQPPKTIQFKLDENSPLRQQLNALNESKKLGDSPQSTPPAPTNEGSAPEVPATPRPAMDFAQSEQANPVISAKQSGDFPAPTVDADALDLTRPVDPADMAAAPGPESPLVPAPTAEPSPAQEEPASTSMAQVSYDDMELYSESKRRRNLAIIIVIILLLGAGAFFGLSSLPPDTFSGVGL